MKRTKMNPTLWSAVLATLVCLVPGPQVASAEVKINLLYVGSLNTVGTIPLAIAQEQGLFAKRSIAVRPVAVLGSDVPRLTVENPFGYIGTPAVLLRAAGGSGSTITGSFNTGRLSGHVVARSDIKKPEELRGKRFGVRTLGAQLWIQTILALEHLGLNPKQDNISILEIGDRTQIFQALEAGTIDAAIVSPAQSRQLTAKGFSVLLDLYPANIYVPANVLAVAPTYIQQSPDVVEKVVAALIESTAFSLSPSNKSTVLHTIMSAHQIMTTQRVTDPAAAEEIYQEFLLAAIRKPYTSLERLRSMQKVMAHHDPKVLNLKVEDLIDDRFVRKLDESGMIDRLQGTYGLK